MSWVYLLNENFAECYVAPALRLYIRSGVKHQYDRYLVKIHLVVHKVMSVLYISLFLVKQILAF